jgi:hypothetical protein
MIYFGHAGHASTGADLFCYLELVSFHFITGTRVQWVKFNVMAQTAQPPEIQWRENSAEQDEWGVATKYARIPNPVKVVPP